MLYMLITYVIRGFIKIKVVNLVTAQQIFQKCWVPCMCSMHLLVCVYMCVCVRATSCNNTQSQCLSYIAIAIVHLSTVKKTFRYHITYDPLRQWKQFNVQYYAAKAMKSSSITSRAHWLDNRSCDNYRQWASYQIRKNEGCECAGNGGNVFPATEFKGNR